MQTELQLLFCLLRKDSREDQLMAAQAHLRLGEVSAESGMNSDVFYGL